MGFLKATRSLSIALLLMIELCLPSGSGCSIAPKAGTEITTAAGIDREIGREIQWVLSLQLPSGAIALSSRRDHIQPYFANLAAWAVLEASPRDAPQIRRWILWYLDHLNETGRSGVRGSIDDYDVRNGQEVARGVHDSSDAYAGTFLLMAKRYFDISGEQTLLRARRTQLIAVGEAILATLGAHGLTHARPDHPVAYLMDNVEAWRGLQSLSEMMTLLPDRPKALYFKALADRLRIGIEERFWSAADQTYLPSEASPSPNPQKLYPDAASTLWPVIYGLPEAEPRKARLWRRFQEGVGLRWSAGSADGFAWSLIAYAGALSGPSREIDAWQQRLRAKNRRVWPWHVGESAGYILYLKAKLAEALTSH